MRSSTISSCPLNFACSNAVTTLPVLEFARIRGHNTYFVCYPPRKSVLCPRNFPCHSRFSSGIGKRTSPTLSAISSLSGPEPKSRIIPRFGASMRTMRVHKIAGNRMLCLFNALLTLPKLKNFLGFNNFAVLAPCQMPRARSFSHGSNPSSPAFARPVRVRQAAALPPPLELFSMARPPSFDISQCFQLLANFRWGRLPKFLYDYCCLPQSRGDFIVPIPEINHLFGAQVCEILSLVRIVQ